MSQESSQASNEVIQEILKAINQLRYGSIEVTVHEGKVTQIERREKVRFSQTFPHKDKPTVTAAATSQH